MKQRQWIALLAFALVTVAIANPTGIVVQDADSVSTMPTTGNLPALAIDPRIILETAEGKTELHLQSLPLTLNAAPRHILIDADANEMRDLTAPQRLPGDLPAHVHFSASYLPFVKR
ncbi:MAG: hypothetical protein H6650_15920 [Ardenticatenales bacterium]|nr:hypothetical protein [Ardenticatenales bacterium]